MDEYISREATVKAFCEKCKGYYDGHCVHRGECDIDVIQTAPASDVQPVRHGRWLNHHAIWIDQPKIEGWFVQAKCSECERWAHVMNPYTKSVDYEHCPHCGARMDSDTNG